MSRVADSTIKGFMYQFNLTLFNLLSSQPGEHVVVEGIIEDIDIISSSNTTAIQCKYHEQQEVFSLSSIYKPVLQMLKTFTEKPNLDIKFVLYAYFPSLQKGEYPITADNLITILSTQNLDYISNYITVIKPSTDPDIINIVNKSNKTKTDKELLKEHYVNNCLPTKCDLNKFLSDNFKFIIGESYNELEIEVKKLLEKEGFSTEDVTDIFYPNSIHHIASLSIESSPSTRQILKVDFVSELNSSKKTAISRWTKELTNYKKLLKIRQSQLSYNLNINNRRRYFIINSTKIESFNDNIVIFLKQYVDTYCHKAKLHDPALFCFQNLSLDAMHDIAARLYTKSIEVQTGYKGNYFFKEAFICSPERKINENWIQFKIRICIESPEILCILNENKPDDLFIISNSINEQLSIKDTNLEVIEIETFNELLYLLKLTKEVDV